MGAQVEASNSTKPRRCAEPAQCVKNNGWTANHVIDIASLEELFQHDGPLLAEDSEWYHFENDAAIPEPEPVPQPQTVRAKLRQLHEPQAAGPELQEKKVEQHMKKVMERIKARKQDEVRQRFDSAIRTAAHRVDLLPVDHVDHYEAYNATMKTADATAEQIVRDAMASLQAAKERMELRTRATAALQAATERAAKNTAAKAENNSAEAEDLKPPPTKNIAIKPIKAPASRNKENDVLQARIQKALAAAQIRHASEAA